ncbi:MAG: hypothetical protein EBR32_06605 [Bacteroidetes bacterium]|jgi:hypothetical protein|nr:hypothetical protein [Bacteroidota bacterium]
MFGLPWFAIIPIVAIVGGLIYAYKEKELEIEEKRILGAREANELRGMIRELQGRIQNLETIAAEENIRGEQILNREKEQE